MTTANAEPVLRTRIYDYSSLRLKGNPFPISGLTADNTPYPLIDKEMDDEVHNFIDETLQEQQYGGLAILGDFGSGKTYALRYIETLLRTIVTRPDAEEILAVYVERPPRTVLGLVADVCNRIGRVRIRNLLLEMIFADLSNELLLEAENKSTRMPQLRREIDALKSSRLFGPDDPLRHLSSPNAVMNPAAAIDVFRNTGLKTTALLDFAAGSLEQMFGRRDSRTNDIARHFAEFAVTDDRHTIRLWTSLVNGKIYSGSQLVGDISGQVMWTHLMLLLRRAGYKMVYWLIDEFEEIDYQSQSNLKNIRSFLAELRDLIDATLDGFGLVLASKVSAWDIYKQIHPAFSQRFSRVVMLPPNSSDDLRRMIEFRLAQVREDSYDGDLLAPFTEAAIRSLESVSAGNTRVAVEACHILLWHAASSPNKVVDESTVDNLANINRAYFYSREGIVPNAGR